MIRPDKVYTSSDVKMLQHLDRLKDMQEGKVRPITLQIAPTDKCNLNCPFCSVKERAMKEWKFSSLMSAIDTFHSMGIKAVEITGGGDPTMYPQINELIEYCFMKGLKIGMITNGVALRKNVSQENLDRLTWLRISLNSLDQMYSIDIPTIKGDLGFSYVYNDMSSRRKLLAMQAVKNMHKGKFLRVVPNCLSTTEIENFKQMARSLQPIYKNMFFQVKDYSKPKRCMFGYLKPFLNSDGYVYHCSAIPLLNRKFDEHFRICHWSKAKKAWEAAKWFDTKKCGICFFRQQNELLEDVLAEVPHKEWV
jgi:MoaA/NifB/PqqE/SkfB family radical SAM enzyme